MSGLADKPQAAPLGLSIAKAGNVGLVRSAIAIVLGLVALRLVLAALMRKRRRGKARDRIRHRLLLISAPRSSLNARTKRLNSGRADGAP